MVVQGGFRGFQVAIEGVKAEMIGGCGEELKTVEILGLSMC